MLIATLSPGLWAQQTVGDINGEVTDSSGAVINKASVTARSVATNLSLNAVTQNNGTFHLTGLPIGTYEVTFSKEGFESAVFSKIVVQADRTSTVNAKLKPGSNSESVTVTATPLLNSTDTTTGYTLDDKQIAEIPLGTGSFTQTAILSPGVNADLLNTAGTNAGLGNQAIWANGQRDTSNNFSLNGVSTNNIFNGKSTSQVTSGRVAVNIGQNTNNSFGGEIGTSTSVYGAIGQALPSPPPETIQELHVNSALYDASQGEKSGAQIEVTTKSGTNAFHGGAYQYYQTTAFDANQWFFGHNGLARPPLHRSVFGGLIGGPIKKDKLFFFGSYQGQRVSDQLLNQSLVAVPPDLTDARDAASLAAVANKDFGTSITPGQITPQAMELLNAKAPNGSYFVPSAVTDPGLLAILQTQNAEAIVQGGGSRFRADQVNANLDYIFSSRDRLAGKYYYQRDPNTTPFANSQLDGFPQTMLAGSQTVSVDNIVSMTPNLTWEQRIGFVRQNAFANTTAFLTPNSIGLSIPSNDMFPQINIKNNDNVTFSALGIGPSDNFANAGVYQNSFEAGTNLQWVHGRQNISTGVNYNYLQLNVINKNNEVARVTFADFPGFLLGQICGPNTTTCSGQDPSQVLNGATNRYYRANQVGAYGQDNIRVTSEVTVNVGLRWDWNGPLSEKYGRLANFYAKDYSYNVATDTINNIGLVVAGNNKQFPTAGVSNSTLTGRQWGFAPRIGLVYSPSALKNFVIRAGYGLYYDRGEYFTELSSPAGGGISGPFGVTVAEPFVTPFYATSNSFATPFGTAPLPPPPSSLAGVKTLVPNVNQLIANTTTFCNNTNQSGCGPFFFGGYDPRNTLPYSQNYTVDFQWQPVNSIVMTLGYVGNHGTHLTIPLPFNQAQIATPQSPLLVGGPYQQNYSYGYNAIASENIFALVDGFPTGNAALRAPYIGYDPNSVFNRDVGISNYNALQYSVTKRFSHGLMFSGSYTYSHTFDEQSNLGLFFSGNDPNNPATSYGTSDFDRTHAFTFSYHYEFPTTSTSHGVVKQIANGWGLNGIVTLQSGQPYSVYDYSGGAASIYWGGGQDAATNPIVPVGGFGSSTNKVLLQGTTGVNANNPVLNVNAFGIPTPYAPGTNGVPPCDSSGCDIYENGYALGQRNIFRGPFQSRWDFGVFKNFAITERWRIRYDAYAFNILNHPSFDIPNNNVLFNPFFGNPPFNPLTNQNGYQFPPSGMVGFITHTVGSPRFLQMALHLDF